MYAEIRRICELQEVVELFYTQHDGTLPNQRQMEDDDSDETNPLNAAITEREFAVLGDYVKAMEPFLEASSYLGGEKYPSASSVIPMLDEVNFILLDIIFHLE